MALFRFFDERAVISIYTLTKKLGNIFWNANKRVMQITSPVLAFLSHSVVIEKCKQKKFKTGLRF